MQLTLHCALMKREHRPQNINKVRTSQGTYSVPVGQLRSSLENVVQGMGRTLVTTTTKGSRRHMAIFSRTLTDGVR
jgi:hypothetical protein